MKTKIDLWIGFMRKYQTSNQSNSLLRGSGRTQSERKKILYTIEHWSR